MIRMARKCSAGDSASYDTAGKQAAADIFNNDDYFTDLMPEWCGKYHVVIWAYCLMPDHINSRNQVLKIKTAYKI